MDPGSSPPPVPKAEPRFIEKVKPTAFPPFSGSKATLTRVLWDVLNCRFGEDSANDSVPTTDDYPLIGQIIGLTFLGKTDNSGYTRARPRTDPSRAARHVLYLRVSFRRRLGVHVRDQVAIIFGLHPSDRLYSTS